MKQFAVLIILLVLVACSAPRLRTQASPQPSGQHDYYLQILRYATGSPVCPKGDYAVAQVVSGDPGLNGAVVTFCALQNQYNGQRIWTKRQDIVNWLNSPASDSGLVTLPDGAR